MDDKQFHDYEKKIESLFELIMGYGIKYLFKSEGGQEKVINELLDQTKNNRKDSKLWELLTERVHEG